MGSNMQGSSQGNYDPTQPGLPPTQYGSSNPYWSTNPYAPPPLPPKNNRPLMIGLVLAIGILFLTVVGLIGFLLGSQRGSPQPNPPLAGKSSTAAPRVTPTSAPTPIPTSIPTPSPTPIPTATPLSTPTTTPVPPVASSCPSNANDAANRYGGDPGSWKELARGEWFYQNANQPLQNITFKNTIHVDWWDNFNSHSGGPGDVTVPFASQLTLYCNPG